jgi:hypothetical protein
MREILLCPGLKNFGFFGNFLENPDRRKLEFPEFSKFPVSMFSSKKDAYWEQSFPIIPTIFHSVRSGRDPKKSGFPVSFLSAYRFNTIRFQYYPHAPL